MSKIARVYHLGKEIQKIYKDGVLKKLFFDWKHYIGEEINIEYARGYCSNRININGKVYQNLANSNTSFTLDNSKISTPVDRQKVVIKNDNCIKPNTTYTIIFKVAKITLGELSKIELQIDVPRFVGSSNQTVAKIRSEIGIYSGTFTTNRALNTTSNKVVFKGVAYEWEGNTSKTNNISISDIVIVEGDLSEENIIEDSIKYLEEGSFKPENTVIEGKTYQNLASDKINYVFSGSNYYYRKTLLANGCIYTRNNNPITTGVNGSYITLKMDDVSSILKSNTKYTLLFNIESTFSDSYSGITISGSKDPFFKNSVSVTENTKYYHSDNYDLKTGYKKITFNTNSNITTYFGIGFPQIQTQEYESYFKITDVIILEGDLTNEMLPEAIKGIESVGERENHNLIKDIVWYNGFINNTTGVIETNATYPDAKYSDLIDIDVNILYKTNITSTYSSFRLRFYKDDGTYYLPNMTCSTFKELYDRKTDFAGAKKIRLLILNTDVVIPDLPYVLPADSLEDGHYPVKQTFYNYNCETDGVILSDGTKNTIEEIDGVLTHVKRVLKYVFTGDEYFSNNQLWDDSNPEYFHFWTSVLIDNWKVGQKHAITNLFPFTTESNRNFSNNEIMCHTANSSVFIFLNKNLVETPDLNGLRKWLKENRTVLYYESTNPIYTPLNGGLYDNIILPNENKNEVYCENGKWNHNRKIGKIVLNGAETWSVRYDDNSDYISFNSNIPSMEKSFIDYNNSSKKMLCDDFEVDGYVAALTSSTGEQHLTKECICGRSNGQGFCISILRSRLSSSTISDFKTWLSNNPITVHYELQIPIITELPYMKEITYKLPQPLRSLPNGVYDNIKDFKLTQRIKKYVINENTNMFKHSTLDSDSYERYIISVDNLALNPNGNKLLINSKIKTRPDASENGLDLFAYIHNSSAQIHVKKLKTDTTFSDGATFKSYLLGESFYYEINTPVETQLLPEQILINGEPLSDTVGITLSDGISDYIDTNGIFINRLQKNIFDGTENWKASTQTNVYYLLPEDLPEGFDGVKQTAMLNNLGIGCSVGNSWGVVITDKTCATVTDFTNKLKTTPMITYVKRNTYIKTPIIKPLPEGTNILTTTNNIQPQLQADIVVRDDFQNLCDNVWESGNINLGTGELVDASDRIRLVNYLEVKPNTKYRIDSVIKRPIYGVRCYGKDKVFISSLYAELGLENNSIFITPSGCYYLRLVAVTPDTSTKIYLKEVIE